MYFRLNLQVKNGQRRVTAATIGKDAHHQQTIFLGLHRRMYGVIYLPAF